MPWTQITRTTWGRWIMREAAWDDDGIWLEEGIWLESYTPLGWVPVTAGDVALDINGVDLIPGTGEYALATTPVQIGARSRAINQNAQQPVTDFVHSIDQLRRDLPRVRSVALVVCWFGSDLRMNECSIKPKVESNTADGIQMPWTVSGLARAAADLVPFDSGRPVYGGTPADKAVVEAIQALNTLGFRVVFYPFILMEQMPGNGLPDPYGALPEQPALPWRGRITLSIAPGQPGTPDKTAAADAEVAAFFGSVAPEDFTVSPTGVTYTGSPTDWGVRRMILHYAHLCKFAGGVDAFCIGTEMRGLTQVRGLDNTYPAVQAFRALASDVRSIVGRDTKIGYAADWSEYFGHQPPDGSGDVFFHLDPLWADANIDFIGIDNYMPLSDWRDGDSHLDAAVADSIYDLDYLASNVAGGEGFDWFYASSSDRDDQIRTPIEDTAYGEHWVFRYKDLVNWWSNVHHNRPGGVRSAVPTDWVPQSKPIWFTEYGCPAIDKGTNQPNVFYDPKSSESFFPYYSNGQRDDEIQRRYYLAVNRHFRQRANNPLSSIYGEEMVDSRRMHAWAWDSRPFPWFPDLTELWSDGPNYELGHWLNGRIVPLGPEPHDCLRWILTDGQWEDDNDWMDAEEWRDFPDPPLWVTIATGTTLDDEPET